MREAERDRQARKRAAYLAQGLTTKGKERKGRAKPAPHQAPSFTTPRQSVLADSPKQRPKVPRNVWRRPVRLPPLEPITDEEREAA